MPELQSSNPTPYIQTFTLSSRFHSCLSTQTVPHGDSVSITIDTFMTWGLRNWTLSTSRRCSFNSCFCFVFLFLAALWLWSLGFCPWLPLTFHQCLSICVLVPQTAMQQSTFISHPCPVNLRTGETGERNAHPYPPWMGAGLAPSSRSCCSPDERKQLHRTATSSDRATLWLWSTRQTQDYSWSRSGHRQNMNIVQTTKKTQHPGQDPPLFANRSDGYLPITSSASV